MSKTVCTTTYVKSSIKYTASNIDDQNIEIKVEVKKNILLIQARELNNLFLIRNF